MPTLKQKTAVEIVLENRGNVSRAMREAGYAPTTAENPKNLTDSKGYREILAQHGLTEELVVSGLVADIKAKVGKRTQELALGAELLGMRKIAPLIANQFNLTEKKPDFSSSVLDQLAERISEELRKEKCGLIS